MTSVEKMYSFMKKPPIMIASFLALIFVFYCIDKPLALYFHRLDWITKAPLLSIFTVLGKNELYIGLFLLLALFFRIIKKTTYAIRFWYLLILILVLALLNTVLKVSFGRARPELFFLNQEYGFYWFKLSNWYWSFPSGHATTVTALVVAVGLMWPNYFFACIFLAFLVMFSRIVLCNHYLSDVLFAFYLNIIMAGIVTRYLKKNKPFKKHLGIGEESEVFS